MTDRPTKQVPSPPYPSIDLAAAKARLRRFVEAAPDGASDLQRTMSALGYGSRSGTSVGVLNSLRQYGLLEPWTSGYRATELAGRLLAEGADASQAALEAARRPRSLAILAEHFPRGGVEAGRATELLAAHGFLPKASTRIIQIYEQTFELVGVPEPIPVARPATPGSDAGASTAPARQDEGRGPRPRYSYGWVNGGKVEVFTSGSVELGALVRVFESLVRLMRAEMDATDVKR